METPMRCRLPTRLGRRFSLISLAKRVPVFFMSAARYVVLPPGAAAMSHTRSPSCGASAMHGRNELAPCHREEPPGRVWVRAKVRVR